MISVLRIFFTARGANPWVVLVCLVVASLCEGFGFATLVPLLGAATGVGNQSFVSESVRGVLHSVGLDSSVGTLILVLVAGMDRCTGEIPPTCSQPLPWPVELHPPDCRDYHVE